MIKDNDGASIEKITICINDTAFINVINNILYKNYLFYMEREAKEQYVKVKIREYLNGITSFSTTKNCDIKQIRFLYTSTPVEQELKNEFVNSLGDEFLLSKYLKIKLQTKEQHRSGTYDGTSDKEIKNSILYEFNVEKYREYTNRNNPIEDVLSIIKMLLFLDISKLLSDVTYNNTDILQNLWDEINTQVDNSIITSLKVTDTLNSSDLLFEDYFYELTQLRMDSFNKVKKINHKKQKITFRIDSFKQYGEPKTSEEQEEEILESAQNVRNKDLAFLKKCNRTNYIDAIESGALADCGIDSENWFGISAHEYYDDYEDTRTSIEAELEDELDDEEAYIEQARKNSAKKLKETCKINTLVAFLKSDASDNKGKGIKIDFLVQGTLNVYKLLFPDEYNMKNSNTDTDDNFSPARHSPDLINQLPFMVQDIFNDGLYSFFQNMVDTVDNFSSIERPSFTPYTNFITKNAIKKESKKQDNLVPKIILAILMDRGGKAFERTILKFFHPTQRKELNTLVTKVDEKIQYYNKEEKRERAISLLYKYFEGKVNAE